MIDVQYKDYNGGSQVSPVVFGPVAEDAILAGAQRGIIIFDDFTRGISSAATSLDGWVVTEITSGQLDDAGEAGGVLKMIGDTADGNGIQMQKSESVYLQSGNKFAVESRVALGDADLSNFVFGLATTDSTLVASLPDDCIVFTVAGGNASIKYKVDKNGSASAVDSGVDFADDVYRKLGFNYNGDDTIEIFIDGSSVGTVTTNLPDDEVLALSLGFNTGADAEKYAKIDWVKVVAEL